MVVEHVYRVEADAEGGRYSIERLIKALADDWGMVADTQGAVRGALKDGLTEGVAMDIYACKIAGPLSEVVQATMKRTEPAADGEEPDTWCTGTLWVRPHDTGMVVGIMMWRDTSAGDDADAYRLISAGDTPWGSVLAAQLVVTAHKTHL